MFIKDPYPFLQFFLKAVMPDDAVRHEGGQREDDFWKRLSLVME